MDEIYAASLVDALFRHPNLSQLLAEHLNAPVFSSQKLFDLLIDTDMHASSRFYVKFPNDPELILTVGIKGNEFSRFSLRRVMRRNNVQEGYQPSLWKKIKGEVGAHYGFFSSSSSTRKLRADYEMREELKSNTWPFALLGKLETRANSQNISAPLVTRTMPIFIIPEASNPEAITRWELENAIYRRHDRPLVPQVITREQYFSLIQEPVEE